MSFTTFILKDQYASVQRLGDRLASIDKKINWEMFRPIIKSAYNDNEKGGRPHTDEVLLAKSLILQGMYSLSDEQLEFQCLDRISFRNFLDFPEKIPDFSTIWYARERLAGKDIDNAIWSEFQRQLNEQGFICQKGVIQDATIQEAKRPNGTSMKKGRDEDGSYSIKGKKTSYGYKLHAKSCCDFNLIREIGTTTASVHDSCIDLLKQGDVSAYRDKGYAGTPVPAGVQDNTLKKGYRGHPITPEQKQENRRLSKIRSPGERPFHVIKDCFKNTLICVTKVYRVHTKNIFTAFAFNLFQLVTLERCGIAVAIKK